MPDGAWRGPDYPDVRVEAVKHGFLLVSNEGGSRVRINRRQAEQILDGLLREGVVPGASLL